jgi:ATP-dependent protease HslVU (ClpYQ) peptidase subunit
MTMIACTINNGFPIIHSDILISENQKAEKFYIPAIPGNLMDSLPNGKLFYPSAFNRKVSIINDRICFAFAGKTWYAEKLLEDLKAYCRLFEETDKDSIMSFFSDYDLTEINHEMSFLIIVMDRNKEGFTPYVLHSNKGLIVKEIGVFGNIYLLGSGASDFIKSAEEINWASSTNPTSPSEAVQINMALISSILSRERVDQHTINNHWGAGIETIYFDGNKFVNLKQVTFVFNHWFLDSEDEFVYPMPTKVTNYKYMDEFLFIVDVEASKWRRKIAEEKVIVELTDFNVGLFVISGIDHKQKIDWSIFKDNISFSSTFVGMGYIIIKGNQGFSPAGFYGSKDITVQYEHNKSLRIEIQRTVYDEVKRVSEECYHFTTSASD